MLILLIAAFVLTLATFILAALWRGVLALARRPAPRFWRRTLKAHGLLFLVHLFVTVPVILGLLFSRYVGTRGDEAGYRGPRIAADGTWQLQTREGLRAERDGKASVDPALVAAAESHAVALTARDGVKLRAFLVAPASAATGKAPRFDAVLVHGLYRGAMELETPGAMLRDLGGQVLLVELRNHGGSAHAKPTYGRDEALDVLAAVDFLRARPDGRGRPFLVYAVSIGTAAAALAAPRVEALDALVLDAPMDDLAATARRELKRGSAWDSIVEPWASTTLLAAQYAFGVPIDQVKPAKALAQLSPKVSVLLIGAGKDERMPPASVRALFDALPTPPERKQLWIDESATHGKVFVTAADEYRRRLAAFLDQALGPQAAPAD